MKIAFISPEVVPFSKTGGLADVAGALPKFLNRLGHEVAVLTPFYSEIRRKFKPRRTGKTISVPVGGNIVDGEIWTRKLPGSKVPVFFIANEDFFGRDGLYGDATGDYVDNCSRFVFFSRGVLEAITALGLNVDVIHSNDWQSGLVPVYCRIVDEYRNAFRKAANVFTIHNMAFQGLFWHWDTPLTNIGWEHFNYKELEFYGKISFLKGGIVFADAVTTVSPTYALEIQSDEELGAGLQGALSDRSKNLFGILNGIDYSLWNPEVDELIPGKYSARDLSGKAACKRALQKRAGLEIAPDVPLVGMVGRLADQKGLDILAEITDELMAGDLQLVILGTGAAKYHDLFEKLSEEYSTRAGVFLSFDDELAHLIEAGSDMFLMPSRYEPCGLSQMISLKYGTVPIVRATGGLADTITDATRENIRAKTANGFSFTKYETTELLATIRRALDAFGDKKRWAGIVRTGMSQDYSWSRSAAEYEKLYDLTRKKKARHAAKAAAG